MTVRNFLMARFYDLTMKTIEGKCLSAWREQLLSETQGDLLEIGSGTRVNLSYYPKSDHRLVMTEPDPHMLSILRKNIKQRHDLSISVKGFSAEHLDFPDNSFDSAVSTLVLCSVDSPEASLMEIRRVLKPGGKFFFIEHGLAKGFPHLMKRQKRFEPLWMCMCGNCHLTRDVEGEITHAGFSFEKVEKTNMSGGPSFVRPTLNGVAVKV